MQTRDIRQCLLALPLLVGLGAVETLLVRIAGPPSGHLRVLAALTSPITEPLAGVLAALALAAQALAAYLALALALRTLTHLPGLAGRAADHAEQMLTIPAVRRSLDALLGGALIAHLALTPAPTGTRLSATPAPPPAVAITMVASSGQDARRDPVHPARAPQHRPLMASATPAPAPSVPLPVWLGGPAAVTGDRSSRSGSGEPAARHMIQPGDTLWSISAAHLPADARSESAIGRYWRRIYGANRDALGSDPDLIHPGVTLSIPASDTPAAAPRHHPGAPPFRFPAPRSSEVAEDPADRLP
ncbi:MAG TPA: LysM domain-containing protein [Actinomycetes bacterium]|jgi:hypothetical protein|nr:LysM domain-containing protein [Actinomycetes bacterium]